MGLITLMETIGLLETVGVQDGVKMASFDFAELPLFVVELIRIHKMVLDVQMVQVKLQYVVLVQFSTM